MRIGIKTVHQLLKAWDSGQTIWSVECGGLGPGYEQAIQIAAVEFARVCHKLKGIRKNDQKSTDRFTKLCEKRLREIDKELCGLSGAQFGAARWIAFQWCFNGGPARLMERTRKEGKEDRCIQVSRSFPVAPLPTVPATGRPITKEEMEAKG